MSHKKAILQLRELADQLRCSTFSKQFIETSNMTTTAPEEKWASAYISEVQRGLYFCQYYLGLFDEPKKKFNAKKEIAGMRKDRIKIQKLLGDK
jgi:hypothetical protein